VVIRLWILHETVTVQIGSGVDGTSTTIQYDATAFADTTALANQINTDFGGRVNAVADDANTISITGSGSDAAFNVSSAEVAGGGAAIATTNPTPAVAGTNDQLTLEIGGTTYNFTIGSGQGEVNTLADLRDAINGTAAAVTASLTGVGSDQLVITNDTNATTFTIGGDANAVTGLGLTAGPVAPDATAFQTDLDGQGGAGAAQTLSITAGGEQFDFQIGGVGGINTIAALTTAVNTASQNGVNLGDLITADTGAGGQLRLTSDNSTTDFTISGTATTGAATYLGDIDGTITGTDGTNDTLSLTVGTTTVDFVLGSDTSEINSLSALVNSINNSSLGSSITASVSGTNQLVLTADDTSTSFTIGGDANAVAGLGLTAETVAPDTVGSNSQITLQVGAAQATFQVGTGTGEVNTLTDLVNAINSNTDISGLVKASNASNQLKLEALSADSSLVVSGSADVGASFGISETTYSPTNLITQGAAQAGTDTTLVTKALTNGAATTLASLGFNANDQITFSDGSANSITVAVGTSTTNEDGLAATVQDVIDELTGGATTLSSDVAISVDANNRLQFSLSNGETLSITNAGNTSGAANGTTLNSAFGLNEATVVGGANQIGDYSTDTSDTSIAYSFSTGASEQNLSIQIGASPSETIEFGFGAGKVSTVSELNTALGNVIGGTASVDADGNLSVDATAFGDDITLSGTVDFSQFGTAANVYTENVSSTRTALETEFNDLRNQINQLAKDASFNGVNLLDGDDLTVTFNEDGSSSLDITGVTFNSTTLGISQIASNGFQTNAAINSSLTELDSALTSLRSQASTFGSKLSVVEIRQDFTKNLTNVLETGAADLTLADTNEEGANLLSLQTRQQLSSVALSLASQADQNVLRLF
jgi:flagellin